jgi:hypothetical protein
MMGFQADRVPRSQRSPLALGDSVRPSETGRIYRAGQSKYQAFLPSASANGSRAENVREGLALHEEGISSDVHGYFACIQKTLSPPPPNAFFAGSE